MGQLRRLIISTLVGISAGLATSAFLYALNFVTNLRGEYPQLIALLPMAGLLIAWVYHVYGREATAGHQLILDEIHNPKTTVPVRMVPLILGGTVITHLCGGSAGREGTAVQMGGALADQIAPRFKVSTKDRQTALVAGLGAGFSAAIGAPWAGFVFGMEVLNVVGIRLRNWPESLVASFAAYGVSHLLKTPHSIYPTISVPGLSLRSLIVVVGLGALFGLTARIFIGVTHKVERVIHWIKNPLLRPVVGGFVLLGLFYILGSDRYAGLGIPVIQESLRSKADWIDPLWKTAFTALTIGTGFKGGEFIPLVFIGSTLGSSLSSIVSYTPGFLAALGFAAVFGAAANTPLACAVMAIEIFGLPLTPFVLVSCFVAYFFSPHQGIYKGQKVDEKKYRLIGRIWKELKDASVARS